MINLGNLLSDSFWKLPSKRYYPNYYHEIRNPLSLMQIGKKLRVSKKNKKMNLFHINYVLYLEWGLWYSQ